MTWRQVCSIAIFDFSGSSESDSLAMDSVVSASLDVVRDSVALTSSVESVFTYYALVRRSVIGDCDGEAIKTC